MAPYDVNKKAYRSWSFRTGGLSFEMSGQWDEKTKTMTLQDMVGDVTVVATMRFLDKDTREVTVLARNPAGKIYLDSSSNLTRIK